MEDDNVEAPESIVLARSLDRDEDFIEELLNQLEELFIAHP